MHDAMLEAESLPDLLHRLVLRAPSGKPAKAVAEEVGKPYHVLMQELNPDVASHKLGAELLIPLMAVTGSDAPLHYLARARGGVFIRLPEAAAPGTRPLQEKAMRACKEFGELMGELGERLGDGVICAKDRRALAVCGQEAVTALMALLRRIGQEDGPADGPKNRAAKEHGHGA